MNIKAFEKELRRENYAANTIVAYKHAAMDYFNHYRAFSKENLLQYKAFLIETYHPKTVNLRIRSINKYLEFIGRPELSLRSIKIPRASFLDNVISNEDYLYYKKRLRREKDKRWYFIVWTLAVTGARISELIQLKSEHVRTGHFDVYSKGGKIRRIYFPTRLRRELMAWAERDSGHLFLNRLGAPLTPRGIAHRLRDFAHKYGINVNVVHPHSFRHLFAKNFLQRNGDLVLLADLLGHDSLDTTRIYLQRSSREQSELIDRVVDW